jgi:hypothetical protein
LASTNQNISPEPINALPEGASLLISWLGIRDSRANQLTRASANKYDLLSVDGEGPDGSQIKPAYRKLTSNIHSSHDLNRPETKRFRVKLANLNITKIDLVEVFVDLLKAENLKSKNLADEYPAFVPADVAAVVHSAKHKPMRINELDRISRQGAQNLADIRCLELHCVVLREVARN